MSVASSLVYNNYTFRQCYVKVDTAPCTLAYMHVHTVVVGALVWDSGPENAQQSRTTDHLYIIRTPDELRLVHDMTIVLRFVWYRKLPPD